MRTEPIIPERYECHFCGASLRRGDWANLDHALAHFGTKEEFLPALHRRIEESGYTELEAHSLTNRADEILAM